MYFPQFRARRMRQSETLRGMVRETRLHPDCLVYPLFVIFGEDVRNPVPSMPGVFQLSITHLVEEAREVASLGVKSVICLESPAKRTPPLPVPTTKRVSCRWLSARSRIRCLN